MDSSYFEVEISEVGRVDLETLADLIKAYFDSAKNKTKIFERIAKVGFYANSGYVSLIDEDDNEAMLNDKGELEDFITLPCSGDKGFLSEILQRYKNGEIKEKDKEFIEKLKKVGGRGI